MLALAAAPGSAIGPDGLPSFGLYRGAVGRADLERVAGHGRFYRLFHRKRWRWVMLATPRVLVACAVVDLSYAANAFVLAADLRTRQVLFDRGYLGLARLSVSVDDEPSRGLARFRAPGITVAMIANADPGALDLRLRARGLELDARLDVPANSQATLVAPVGTDGTVNVTVKASALRGRGELRANDQTYTLDDSIGGFDYTNGLLARETAWRWAFATGRAADGRIVGLNLVQGFNESGAASENLLWVDGELVPLGGARFAFDPAATLEPWGITTDDARVDLVFAPIGQHRERRELMVARSWFVQACGTFSGRIETDLGRIEVNGLPGVTEDQRVTW